MRIELTLRDAAAVDAAVGVIRACGLRSVNLTDTSKGVDTIAISERLLSGLPGLDLMLHVAAKHFDSAEGFRGHVSRAAEVGVKKLLVVSGHPRRELDSLA